MTGFSKKTSYLILFFLPVCAALVVFDCASSSGQFTVRPLYTKKAFSGGDLGGRQITVSPVLTPNKRLSDGELSSELLLPAISKRRHSLRLIPHELFDERYIQSGGEDALDSFYFSLYKGNMIESQNAEKAWKQVNSDFMMVLKLTWGMRIKKGEKSAARRIRLEGELWECDSMEVVWRIAVDGQIEGESATDRQVMADAVCAVFESLPQLTPGYGKGRW